MNNERQEVYIVTGEGRVHKGWYIVEGWCKLEQMVISSKINTAKIRWKHWVRAWWEYRADADCDTATKIEGKVGD